MVITFIFALLLAHPFFLHTHQVVILGESACSNPQYLEHARQPHRVMSTVTQAWCNIVENLNNLGVTTVVASRESMHAYPDADLYIYWDFPFGCDPLFITSRADKTFIVLNEPTSVIAGQYDPCLLNSFNQIFTWNTTFAQQNNYNNYRYPLLKLYEGGMPFHERKFACIMCGNRYSCDPNELYSTRRAIISFFNQKYPDLLDLYGPLWYGISIHRGYAPDKLPCLQQYKFNFCLENTRNVSGYVTEKIFDAMQAGAVPIYEGASNIDDYIPSNCYVPYNKFSSLQELFDYLQAFTETDYEYYQQNIRTFLASEQAKKFEKDQFVELFTDKIRSFLAL